ncbi:hypothetical protein SAMN04487936_104160 [Halobacillus dabanensis]|uniref:CDP-Glycerol:Poly(Glycerophosphate) glycerophosphotransferase n=1 Tax=Halobacillus dabanensis TaxID=240302 RepID=A0A1I3U7F6_HALDA|nr:hypothetical protein [Halobacillus dabanensis]SFJ77786.1 hypothetical protein SAMN04487936_104160 [Halobacillus dabanensis]
MNTFEKNYWGLYMDFLAAFKDWDYQGISLSLCTHFYSLVQSIPNLEKSIIKPSYSKLWADKSVLQGRFETYLPAYQRQICRGKVIYYDKLLRIPYPFYKELSPLTETVLLKPEVTNMIAHPVPGATLRGLKQYGKDVDGQVRKQEKRFTKIAGAYKSHPLFGKRQFLTAMKKQIAKIIHFVEASESFLMKEEASLIVLGETNSIDTRALTLSARKRGIPTICLQHGAMVSSFGYLPKVADYQGVYGRYEQTLFEKRGIDRELVPMIGHPRFDEMVTRKPLPPSQLDRKTKAEKKVLLIDHHTDKAMIHRVIKLLLKDAPDLDLVIKVQKGGGTFDMYAKHKRVHLVRRVHLYDLLAYVDAVISYESTVVLESLLLGKKTFVWNLNQSGLTDYFNQLPVSTYQKEDLLVHDLLTFMNERNPSDGDKLSKQVRPNFYIPSNQKSTLLLKALIDSIRD